MLKPSFLQVNFRSSMFVEHIVHLFCKSNFLCACCTNNTDFFPPLDTAYKSVLKLEIGELSRMTRFYRSMFVLQCFSPFVHGSSLAGHSHALTTPGHTSTRRQLKR